MNTDKSKPLSLRDIFAEVCEASPDDRLDRLNELCDGNEELRRQVQELLSVDDNRGTSPLDRLGAALGATEDTFEDTGLTGATVDGYTLKEMIGEGGMGEVFVAEQKTPVRRRVALKIIKRGMASKDVVARFEAERQALALMSHANIAKVLDGGTTDDGRPYFVMELVRGIPITEFCDEHKFTLRQRLELFVRVCRAVQHAHQKGIIHRDLKPSNVLVELHDVEAVPKVIDFGIAKATNQQIIEQSIYTNFAQVIGTPLYMSPEQAQFSGIDIDTRSDVYSLGVMLYEILTGTTPFDSATVNNLGLDEVRRLVREEDPPRPSDRVSTLAKAEASTVSTKRRMDSRELSVAMQRELDWIVMKALEKDRTRRYESASDFAQDVERYLKDEPVVACPPTWPYRLQKFARRHRIALATSAIVSASLLIGLGLSLWQTAELARQRNRAVAAERQAREAAERAESEAETANAINLFLNEGVLAQANTAWNSHPEVTLRDAVERAAQAIGDRFADQPMIEAGIRQTLAEAFLSQTQYDQAEEQAARLVELRRANLGPNHVDTIRAEMMVLNAVAGKDLANAATIASQLEAKARRHLGERHTVTMELILKRGVIERHRGTFEESERLLSLARSLADAELGRNNAISVDATLHLAIVYDATGRLESAQQMYEEVVAHRSREFGEDDHRTIDALENLANVYAKVGQRDKALEIQRRSLRIRRRILGDTHLSTLLSMINLGMILNQRHEYGEAEGLLRQAVGGLHRSKSVSCDFILGAERHLAKAIFGQERRKEAIALLEAAVARPGVGDAPNELMWAKDNLANMYWRDSQLSAAEELMSDVIELRRAMQGSDSLDVFLCQIVLARVLVEQKDFDNASRVAMEAIEGIQRVLHSESAETTVDHPAIADGINGLVIVSWDLATKPNVDRPARSRAVELSQVIRDLRPMSANNWSNYGVALWANEQYEEAVEALKHADTMKQGKDLVHRMFLAMALWKTGNEASALERYAEGVRWIASKRPNSSEQRRFRAQAEKLMGIGVEQREQILAESNIANAAEE